MCHLSIFAALPKKFYLIGGIQCANASCRGVLRDFNRISSFLSPTQ